MLVDEEGCEFGGVFPGQRAEANEVSADREAEIQGTYSARTWLLACSTWRNRICISSGITDVWE